MEKERDDSGEKFLSTKEAKIVREREMDAFLADNKLGSGDEDWDKKMQDEYSLADWSLTYRVNRDGLHVEEGTTLLDEGKKDAEPIDVVARLAKEKEMRGKLPLIYKKLQEELSGSSARDRDRWYSKTKGLVGSEDAARFELGDFFETPKALKVRERREKDLVKQEKKRKADEVKQYMRKGIARLLEEHPELRKSTAQKIVDVVGWPFEMVGRGTLYVCGYKVDKNEKLVPLKK